MSNPVSSVIFAYRNADKTKNGDIGRAPVFVGQATNVFNEISKLDNIIGTGAKSASSIFCNLSHNNKVMEYAGKGLKFASEHVNPLICASSAVKVGLSKDKPRTAVVEVGALSGMFLGEGLMKRNLYKVINEKNINNLAEKSTQNKLLKPLAEKILKPKVAGKIATITKGITFACGSIMSYAAGEKLGNSYADKITPNLKPKKINQKA